MDATTTVDMDKLNLFMGKMLGDVGAAANAALIRTGDRLGLYKTLAEKGPMTSAELAKATGTTERYVREWLSAQAASGYVEYDTQSKKFSMLPEQAMVFADEDSPVFMGAIGDMMAALMLDEPKVSDAFKSGKGVGWNERTECLSAAPRDSSAPPTNIIWCRSGCPRWKAWSPSWSAAPRWPMSVAVTASRRC